MIIIPEIETVVVLVPRTGSRALKNAVEMRYPRSFLLYRHMEADGVPFGYDRWRRIGVLRHPVDRLWSLYKYLDRFGLDWCEEHDETYTAKMRASVAKPFDEWLISNNEVFTSPYDSAGRGRFWPMYSVRHPLPENRKSQFLYLRPDLGTKIYQYAEIDALFRDLDIAQLRLNSTRKTARPRISSEAAAYVMRWFAWDFDNLADAEKETTE